MWQALREELYPKGLEVVTVALELRGAREAGRWIEPATPRHPSLIDQGHLMDELFGVVNVPSGIWIDESGTIVRPAEPAYPARPRFQRGEVPGYYDDPRLREVLAEARKIRVEPEKYVAALRDWIEKGAESRFPLRSEEVLARSAARPPEAARAAAHFELGQHLHRSGHPEDAAPHFRAAHRLQPENWTYKRQAWSLVDRAQGPSEVYEGDWLSEVRRVGAENYYPPLDM